VQDGAIEQRATCSAGTIMTAAASISFRQGIGWAREDAAGLLPVVAE